MTHCSGIGDRGFFFLDQPLLALTSFQPGYLGSLSKTYVSGTPLELEPSFPASWNESPNLLKYGVLTPVWLPISVPIVSSGGFCFAVYFGCLPQKTHMSKGVNSGSLEFMALVKQITRTDGRVLALRPLKNRTETQTHTLWVWDGLKWKLSSPYLVASWCIKWLNEVRIGFTSIAHFISNLILLSPFLPTFGYRNNSEWVFFFKICVKQIPHKNGTGEVFYLELPCDTKTTCVFCPWSLVSLEVRPEGVEASGSQWYRTRPSWEAAWKCCGLCPDSFT